MHSPSSTQSTSNALLNPSEWIEAQSRLAVPLARAAQSLGALDATIAMMGQGALTRLALIEVEAMMWAQGNPLRREDLGRDLMDARAGIDIDAMAQARWAIRRLEGRGTITDLRDFLGLHRGAASGSDLKILRRPTGRDFDAAESGFQAMLSEITQAHPITQAAFARFAWLLSDMSPASDVADAATFAARIMAQECQSATFVPMGGAGRRVWTGSGPAYDRLAAWIGAVRAGTESSLAALKALRIWRDGALRQTARIKGSSSARIIDALLAQPLMTTEMVEIAAAISRDTAERMLVRLTGMGLVREVTGTKRFRLWTAAA